MKHRFANLRGQKSRSNGKARQCSNRIAGIPSARPSHMNDNGNRYGLDDLCVGGARAYLQSLGEAILSSTETESQLRIAERFLADLRFFECWVDAREQAASRNYAEDSPEIQRALSIVPRESTINVVTNKGLAAAIRCGGRAMCCAEEGRCRKEIVAILFDPVRLQDLHIRVFTSLQVPLVWREAQGMGDNNNVEGPVNQTEAPNAEL